MGLTKIERRAFVDALIQRGWGLENGTIWAPSHGLYFSESHFDHWRLEDFREIFSQRAQRIRKLLGEGSAQSANENQDISDVADELLHCR